MLGFQQKEKKEAERRKIFSMNTGQMRRVALEIEVEDFRRIIEGGKETVFDRVKSLETIHFLRLDEKEIAFICRVEFADPRIKIKEILKSTGLIEIQLLERLGKGTYTLFIRRRPNIKLSTAGLTRGGGYLLSPFGIANGKLRLAFLGSMNQIEEFLKRVESTGIHCRIVSVTEAKFSPNSPLNRLTAKQRDVLASAYRLGYYDLPRRINSEDLARELGLVSSTLVEHLRKAEFRLMTQLFND